MIYTFFVLSLLSLVFGQDCSNIKASTGYGVYDLSPLVDRLVEWKDSGLNYKATICSNAFTSDGINPSGFCQFTDRSSDCGGVFSQAVSLEDNTGVELFYDSGDKDVVGRIHVLCDDTVDDITVPTWSTNANFITVRSKYACLVYRASNCKKILDAAGSGSYYDLTPIIGRVVNWSYPLSNFRLSVCADSFPTCGCGGASGFCEYTNTWSDCVGKFNIAVGLPNSLGVQLFYDTLENSGRVQIVCDSAVEFSAPTYGDNPKSITIRSKYACLCQWKCVAPF
jgi:hypothetical protein